MSPSQPGPRGKQPVRRHQPPELQENEPPLENDESQSEGVSSTGSSGAEFLEDPGPEFDPKKAPPAPAVEEPQILFEEWDEQRIKEFLRLQGEVTHAFLNAGPEDTETWLHTERDLKAIAPPLTRILNRYDATRAAAAAGDEILLASGLARYASRSYVQRRRYLAARKEQGPHPVTGVPAPEGSVPEDWESEGPSLAEMPPAITPKGARR